MGLPTTPQANPRQEGKSRGFSCGFVDSLCNCWPRKMSGFDDTAEIDDQGKDAEGEILGEPLGATPDP